MPKYKRYVVVGKDKLRRHSYSAELKDNYQHAVNCADHWTMRGNVYGVDEAGQETLLREFPTKKTP